jgi:hypothetical protein
VAAFKQGARTVGGGAPAALLFGVVATLISAATAMSQVERGANRIYGLEQDRPTLKYGVGLLLACTTGRLMVLAFMLIVAGADIAKATNFSGVAWAVLRWPLSILFLVIAVALLLKAAPKTAAAGRLLAGRRLGASGAAVVCVHRPARAVPWPEHDLRADLRPTGRHDRHPRLGAADLPGSLSRPDVGRSSSRRSGPASQARHGAAGQQPGPGTSPAGRPLLRPAAEQYGGVERLQAGSLAQKRDDRLPEGGAA